MNCAEKIIDRVKQTMFNILDDNELMMLEDVLVTTLYQYDVAEKSTEVAVFNDEPFARLNQFLATKRVEGLSETTLYNYRITLEKLLVTVNKDLNDYNANDLRYYLACYKKQRNIKNITVNNMRRVFSTFFQWLCDEEIVTRNPMRKFHKVKEAKRVRKTLTEKELELLRLNCNNKRDRALVEFLYASGCRVSEAANINIEQVDFAKNECIVTGKGNKERTVYFTDTAKLHLKLYIDTRVKKTSGALFCSLKNQFKGIKKAGIESAMRRLGRRAGVHVTPHKFRHTITTVLIDRGINIQDMQQILGHESIATTQLYYQNNERNTKYAYMKIA